MTTILDTQIMKRTHNRIDSGTFPLFCLLSRKPQELRKTWIRCEMWLHTSLQFFVREVFRSDSHLASYAQKCMRVFV